MRPLDELMEELLKEKQYQVMKVVLERIKSTYLKYDIYHKKLEEAKKEKKKPY